MAEYVYFVQSDSGAIKIGTTKNVSVRVKSLSGGVPGGVRLLKVVSGGRKLERQLHVEFAGDRIGFEWFKSSDALRARMLAFPDAEPVHVDRPKADDPHTLEARTIISRWVNDYTDSGMLMRDAWAYVAGEIGVPVGSVENLYRGRILEISTALYCKVKTFNVRKLEQLLRGLIAEKASVERDFALGKTIEQAREVISRK